MKLPTLNIRWKMTLLYTGLLALLMFAFSFFLYFSVERLMINSLDEAVALPATDLPNPERQAQSAEIQRRVQGALADLSPLERAAFTLRHYEGRSIEEISRTLGLGTSAAKHSVFRAVKKLRAALAPLRSQES